jgi:hypothetical protein
VIGIPVITLEVEGMRASIKTALTEYMTDLSSEIAEAVDRVCTAENVQALVTRQVQDVMVQVIREEVSRYYRQGPGQAAVRDIVESILRSQQ